jgi:hypothetical protein
MRPQGLLQRLQGLPCWAWSPRQAAEAGVRSLATAAPSAPPAASSQQRQQGQASSSGRRAGSAAESPAAAAADWTQAVAPSFSVRPSFLSPLYPTYQRERAREERRGLASRLLEAHLLLSNEVEGYDDAQVVAAGHGANGWACGMRAACGRGAAVSASGAASDRPLTGL